MHRILYSLVFAFCFATVAQAGEVGPSSVWVWRSATGTLSFADTREHIPSAYREQAKQVEWQTVEASTDKHWTPIPSSEKYMQGLKSYLESSRQIRTESRPEICNGIPAAKLVRRQFGVYSREVWVITDACGRETLNLY